MVSVLVSFAYIQPRPDAAEQSTPPQVRTPLSLPEPPDEQLGSVLAIRRRPPQWGPSTLFPLRTGTPDRPYDRTTIAGHGLAGAHREAEAVDQERGVCSAQAAAVPVRPGPVPAGCRRRTSLQRGGGGSAAAAGRVRSAQQDDARVPVSSSGERRGVGGTHRPRSRQPRQPGTGTAGGGGRRTTGAGTAGSPATGAVVARPDGAGTAQPLWTEHLALAGRALTGPQPGVRPVAAAHRSWHTSQVFHGSPARPGRLTVPRRVRPPTKTVHTHAVPGSPSGFREFQPSLKTPGSRGSAGGLARATS